MHAPGDQTHDLGIAVAMLYQNEGDGVEWAMLLLDL